MIIKQRKKLPEYFFFNLYGLLSCCLGKTPFKLYSRGEDRLNKRLDVIYLYQKLANLQVMKKVIFSPKQRHMLKLQRQFVLDSQSSEPSSSDEKQCRIHGMSDGSQSNPQSK